LIAGTIQKEIAEIRAARVKNIATRKDALTGTSEFPDFNEATPAVLDMPKPSITVYKPAVSSEVLPRIRLAEPFEKLRDAARTAKPQVFLANLGTPADFTARATFAKNFFEAGGIKAPGNDGFDETAALVSAFRQSGALIACLCSSDEVYGSRAAAAAEALKQAGAKAVYLAGRPGENEAAWRKSGVNSFIFAGSDVLAALQQIHATIGLK
jgi:methylmalonyl-CoA mutase